MAHTCLGQKHVAVLGLTRTFQCIIQDISFHPCKMGLTQQLKLTDYSDRSVFCERMLDAIHNGEMNLSDLVFSEEAYFHLDGNVNKQNY